VRIDPVGVRTSRKPAALVARFEESAQGRGDGPGFPAHIERFAVLVFDDSDDARVAGEATSCFRGNRGAFFDLAATRLFVTERFRAIQKR